MSDIESSATVTVPSYPKDKVIEIYGLLGGTIGGLFLWLTMIVPNALLGNNSLVGPEVFNITNIYFITIFNMICLIGLIGFLLILSMFFGFILGSIPSLLTGYILANTKTYRSYKGFLISLVTGSLIGFTFLSLLDLLDLPFIIRVLTGGVSAVVTGLIALPKHQ